MKIVAILALVVSVVFVSAKPGLARTHRHFSNHHFGRYLAHRHFRHQHPRQYVVRTKPDLGRPYHIVGDLVIGLLHFAFGTGGYAASIPLGSYKVTPEAVGPWGRRHDAIGIANNTIKDPKLGVREGIEIHSGRELASLGCVVILENKWKEFKEALLEQKRIHGNVYLHVGANSASISPEE